MGTIVQGLSAVTGKLCVFGHLGLVFIWSCFVSGLLFLLFYVVLRNLCSVTNRRKHVVYVNYLTIQRTFPALNIFYVIL